MLQSGGVAESGAAGGGRGAGPEPWPAGSSPGVRKVVSEGRDHRPDVPGRIRESVTAMTFSVLEATWRPRVSRCGEEPPPTSLWTPPSRRAVSGHGQPTLGSVPTPQMTLSPGQL